MGDCMPIVEVSEEKCILGRFFSSGLDKSFEGGLPTRSLQVTVIKISLSILKGLTILIVLFSYFLLEKCFLCAFKLQSLSVTNFPIKLFQVPRIPQMNRPSKNDLQFLMTTAFHPKKKQKNLTRFQSLHTCAQLPFQNR